MLAVSALMSAANTVAAALSPSSCHTPSRNPCMIRVEKTRYRNDPYNFRVLPPSPMQASSLAAAVASSAPQQTFTAVSSSKKPAPVPVSAVMPIAPAAVASSPVARNGAAQRKMGSTRYAFVDFKHDSKTFIAPFKISAGDIVVVEGDRGENIGVVSEITTVIPTYAVQSKVVRKATEHDLVQLDQQRAKEAAAVQTVAAAVSTLGLKATVVDCEFQFDLNKLSIFVERPSKKAFVDFRKLQRGLFRDFRCRIWLNYMDEVDAARAEPRSQ